MGSDGGGVGLQLCHGRFGDETGGALEHGRLAGGGAGDLGVGIDVELELRRLADDIERLLVASACC